MQTEIKPHTKQPQSPTHCPLWHTHTSTHTSFPRQDLKTSIAAEFIKEAWCVNRSCEVFSLCCYLGIFPVSRTVPSVTLWMFPCLVFSVTLSVLQVSSREDFRFNSSFLPPPLLCLTVTHREREGEEEGRSTLPTSCQYASVSTLLSQNLLPFSSLSFPPLSSPSLKWQSYKNQAAYKKHPPPIPTHTLHTSPSFQ